MKQLFSSCVIAFSTYSRIPMPQVEWSEKNMRYTLSFFPLVGVVIGVLFWLADVIGYQLGLGMVLRSAILTALPVAVTGGVASAVKDAIQRIAPDREVNIEHADGLRECRKMLMIAKTGKYNGYLLEGMGCPGGCVAGAGTITPVKKSTAGVAKYKAAAPVQNAVDSKATERLEEVEEN